MSLTYEHSCHRVRTYRQFILGMIRLYHIMFSLGRILSAKWHLLFLNKHTKSFMSGTHAQANYKTLLPVTVTLFLQMINDRVQASLRNKSSV